MIAYGARRATRCWCCRRAATRASVVAALAEARRRGLRTVALVGYDGGRIAAERLADHVVLTPSQHIPRIQEAQATAYHLLCDLVERVDREPEPASERLPRARRRRRAVRGVVQGVGFRPFVYGLARRQGLTRVRAQRRRAGS